MQPQGQQMSNMQMQGHTVPPAGMDTQVAATQLTTPPAPDPAIIQSPGMIPPSGGSPQAGGYQIFRYADPNATPSPQTAVAAAPPPPPPPGGPNGPNPIEQDKTFNPNQTEETIAGAMGEIGNNQGDVSPTVEKSFGDIEERKAKFQKQLEGFREDLTPDEREIYKKVFG